MIYTITGGESIDPGVGSAEPLALPNDIYTFVGTSLTNAQKLAAYEEHFKPDQKYRYPIRMEYGKKRSFNHSWLDAYSWLAYSPSQDGAFCRNCVLFGNVSNDKGASKLDHLIKSPLTFWTTASKRLKDHESKSIIHKNATLMANEFCLLIKNKKKSIGEQLNAVVASQIAENRKKLSSIVKTILLCGRQNLPLRGHRELEASLNCGNFRALLAFRIDSGDAILEGHLATAQKNATYVSNTIQNSLISVIGKSIQHKILEDIHAGSKVFSVIADEGRDCANKEQMPIVIRYMNDLGSIREDFLAFVECQHGTTGEQLASLIETTCLSMGLDMNLCRGQGYDGAGNMAGVCKGAAAIIRSKYPKAFYFHCASHKLNLCVVHACQLSSVSNMMSTVTGVANFFNFSPTRQKSLEAHIEDSLKSKLLPLCRTRWVERINALEVMSDLLESTVSSLTTISLNTSREWNRDSVTQATSYLKSIDFDFIINLVITQKVLAFISGITTGLQKRGIDMGEIYNQVRLVLTVLQRTREDVESFHQDCYDEACTLARKLDVDCNKPRTCSRQIHRQNAAPLSTSPAEQVKDYYRCNVTIPVLDDMCACLSARFCEGQEVVVKGMMLLPSSTITVDNWDDAIQPFLDLYRDEVSSDHILRAEIVLWKQMWSDKWDLKWKVIQEQHVKATGSRMKVSANEMKKLKKGAVPDNISSTLNAINSETFPNIHFLLSVLAVLPLTTCEAERNISCLRRLKTYMRSTMSEERLTGLALMNIHRDMNIDIDEVINIFAREHPRRMKMECILQDC